MQFIVLDTDPLNDPFGILDDITFQSTEDSVQIKPTKVRTTQYGAQSHSLETSNISVRSSDALSQGKIARLLRTIEKELPPMVTREKLTEVLGGMISPKTLSNQDSMNDGPAERLRIGQKVAYTKRSVMKYLRERLVWN